MAHTYGHILHQIFMFGKRCDLEHCVRLVFGEMLIIATIQCTQKDHIKKQTDWLRV
jgi:hypothetical protein